MCNSMTANVCSMFNGIAHCECENNFIKIMRAKIFTAQYPIKENMLKLRKAEC